MSEDLQNEVEAINSIYGEETLTATETNDIYILRIPLLTVSFKLQFSTDYPFSPPVFLGSDTFGKQIRREDSTHIVEAFKESLGSIYEPGLVCIFDVIEDLSIKLQSKLDAQAAFDEDESLETLPIEPKSELISATGNAPPWTVSEVVTESKSVFVARAAPVSSPDQAKRYLEHLLHSDKKVRSATHNITAWRIKGHNGVTFQDCDDDGETAAGGRVLHLMQLMDLWNTMVVVTRWYGGQQLGPKRFSIINTVARDAFVKGNFVEETTSKKKVKR